MTREFERPRRQRRADPAGQADQAGTPPPERPIRLLPFTSLRRGEGQAWMVTFTDLIALMLTFFVMLFAMMKVEEQSWRGVTASLAEHLDGIEGPRVALPRYERDSEATPLAPATDLDYLTALVGSRLEARSDAGAYRVERGAASLVVRLPFRLAFAPGDSEPRAAAAATMVALADILRHLDNRVELAGYAGADDPAAPYASAWELSLVRAAAVAAILREAGYERPVVVRGYGSAAAEGAAGALAGGRVEVVVHADGGELR